MNKKQVQKVQDDITKTLDNITKKATEFADAILAYFKKHKKLIAVSIAMYVAYKFLFSDGDKFDDEE